jgi:hypothetical protein
MADRQFLVNQAILSSSSNVPKMGQTGSFMMGGRIGTASTGASLGMSQAMGQIASPPFSGVSTSTNMKRRHGHRNGARNFHSDARALTSANNLKAGDQLFGMESAPGTHNNQMEGLSSVDQDMIATSQFDEKLPEDEGQGKVTDPINALKSIFKPRQNRKRAPVDLNPIMNKYKQRNYSSKIQFRSAKNQRD